MCVSDSKSLAAFGWSVPCKGVDETREELVVEVLHLGHAQVEFDGRLLAEEQLQARDHIHQQLAVRADSLTQPLPRADHLLLLFSQNLFTSAH
jgi:hypothetical protein